MIKNLKATVNKNIGDLNFTLSSDKHQNSLVNVTIVTKDVITKMLVYVKVRAPSNENDFDYQRVLLNTVQDMDKLLNRAQSDVVISKVIQDVLKSCEQDFKFPLPKVSLKMNFMDAKFIKKSIFQGVYRFINSTFKDDFLFIKKTIKVFYEMRIVIKVKSSKRNMHAYNTSMILELRPNNFVRPSPEFNLFDLNSFLNSIIAPNRG